MSKYKYVGERIPRLDGPDKATGRARYMTDLRFPNMLYGKAVRAPHPHAVIESIDTRAAREFPGVRGVYTAEDVPGVNLMGILGQKNQPVFAFEKTRYIGDVLAFVVAETQEQADAAARAVSIAFSPLPVYTSPLEALREGAVEIHKGGNILDDTRVAVGDVDAVFAQAHLVVENTYATHRQHHGYIETLGGFAVPDGAGGMTLYTPCQDPYNTLGQLSAILGLPLEQLHVVASPVGGSFGGKNDLYFQPHMAIAALRTGRPVFVHASREESMATSITNQPFLFKMRTAADKDGLLLAQEAEIVCDTGAYAGFGAVITRWAMENCCGCYQIPHVRASGTTVHTNLQHTGEWKGFGNNPTHFALELQMDEIASLLKMDPVELRQKNMYRPGALHSLGHAFSGAVGALDTLDEAAASPAWLQREAFKATPSRPWMKRGVGIASCVHPFAGTCSHTTALSVSPEGRYIVHASMPEIGAGTGTALCIMAAEAMQAPLKHVALDAGSTRCSKNSGPSTSSRGNYAMGNTTLQCAARLKTRMIACASRLYGLAPDALDFREGAVHAADGRPLQMGRICAALAEAGLARVEATFDVKHPVMAGSLPNRLSLWSYMTQVVGVEVNTLTGKTEVLFADAYVDAGQVINRLGYEGQVEGGIVMGMGMALFEEMLYSDEGKLRSSSLQTYLIPTIRDMPDITVHDVPVLEESGPFGAKGIGEMPAVAIVPAIANAIFDAVGIRVRELPITPEKLYALLCEKGLAYGR